MIVFISKQSLPLAKLPVVLVHFFFENKGRLQNNWGPENTISSKVYNCKRLGITLTSDVHFIALPTFALGPDKCEQRQRNKISITVVNKNLSK